MQTPIPLDWPRVFLAGGTWDRVSFRMLDRNKEVLQNTDAFFFLKRSDKDKKAIKTFKKNEGLQFKEGEFTFHANVDVKPGTYVFGGGVKMGDKWLLFVPERIKIVNSLKDGE